MTINATSPGGTGSKEQRLQTINRSPVRACRPRIVASTGRWSLTAWPSRRVRSDTASALGGGGLCRLASDLRTLGLCRNICAFDPQALLHIENTSVLDDRHQR